MSELKSNIPSHRVSVSLGYTVNAGNFESLRIDVGIEVDGAPGETPTQTYERASKWVTQKLQDQVSEARRDNSVSESDA